MVHRVLIGGVRGFRLRDVKCGVGAAGVVWYGGSCPHGEDVTERV